MRVPDVLIRRLCFPHGYRLPDREVLLFPAPKRAIRVAATALVVSRPDTRRTTIYPDRMPSSDSRLGNLSNEQYQFFRGQKAPHSVYSECRWCEHHLFSPEERNKHLLAFECKRNLTDLYRKLRRDRICVICEKNTKKTKWGVPLCGDACVAEFRTMHSPLFVFERNVLKCTVEDETFEFGAED